MSKKLDALRRLDLITSESGWFVYCLEEKEWHLYNDNEELLFSAPTIEDLANRKCTPAAYTEEGNTPIQKVPKLSTDPITVSDDPRLQSYEQKGRLIHGNETPKTSP